MKCIRLKKIYTYCPLDVWTSNVISVEVAGHIQFKANMAYLNSSSQTTWSVGNKIGKLEQFTLE